MAINYFHWLFDILKIKLFSKLYNIEDLNYLYLSKLENYQRTTFDCLGLNKIKIIDAKSINIYRQMNYSYLSTLGIIKEQFWSKTVLCQVG